MKIFLVILDFELHTGPKKQKTALKELGETAVLQKRSLVIIWRRQSPNKRITIEKCFILPMMDYDLGLIFGVLNKFRWWLRLRISIVIVDVKKYG